MIDKEKEYWKHNTKSEIEKNSSTEKEPTTSDLQKEIQVLNTTFKNYLHFSSLFLILISLSLTTIISIAINVSEKIEIRPHGEIICIIGFIFLFMCGAFLFCSLISYCLIKNSNKIIIKK